MEDPARTQNVYVSGMWLVLVLAGRRAQLDSTVRHISSIRRPLATADCAALLLCSVTSSLTLLALHG
jgi:hypothetical protein